MKHDKKQHQIRKKIWKMPFLVEELFKDEDWKKYDSTLLDENVPTDDMKTVIQKAVQELEERETRKAIRNYRILRLLRYSTAAAVFIFFSFHFVTWWTKDTLPQPHPKQAVVAHHATRDTSWMLIENNDAQSRLLKLSDGSHVRLFAHSRIRYAKSFTDHTRDIELVGKAYFDVASDPGRPFSVFAGGTKTTALGTSFTIHTTLKNKSVQVALHTGKVLISSVTNRFKQVFLSGPEQKFSLDHLGRARLERPHKQRPANEGSLSTAALLNLRNIPMPAVLEALEVAFQQRIYIGDKGISEIHYTGQIDVRKDQLKDILTTLCLINELRYVVNADGSYTLYKQGNTITEHLNN